jgi:hypothetical protein
MHRYSYKRLGLPFEICKNPKRPNVLFNYDTSISDPLYFTSGINKTRIRIQKWIKKFIPLFLDPRYGTDVDADLLFFPREPHDK